MVQVNFYTKKNCPLCEDGLEILNELRREMNITIEEIDIYEDDELLEEYQLKIPVVEVGGEELDYGRLSETKLRRRLKEIG
ncbi:MAG TPA: glutaredoxin family protein [Bacillales bacterium]